MNADIYVTLLCIVVAWPLLLAIPALHSRLPRHLAIMPAALLAILPGEATLELPWLLFGTGLAIDGESRWILLMCVALWFSAATLTPPTSRDFAGQRTRSLFSLTLAGNLGVILATDLVGFFCFSTLMSYGFYGLLIQGGDDAARRAGHRYLIFLIVADLLLFEALLLAAFTTENLRFEIVGEAMAGASSSQFYLWMVLIGFMLKAGVWPAHLWLTAAFSSAPRSTTLLLGSVPVAMALFGLVRWLPLGEHAFEVAALIIQGVGLAAMLYAVLRFITQASRQNLPAWMVIALTGLLITALGTGLANPEEWGRYGFFAYPAIALIAVLPAILTFIAHQIPGKPHAPPPAPWSGWLNAVMQWATRWTITIQQWMKDRVSGLQSLFCVLIQWGTKQYQHISIWQKLGSSLSGWSVRITMFVLLALAIAWLAA